MNRERVVATPRGPMTKARRLRIYLRCNGRCVCGVKVPMEGTVIDHPITLWMGGPDEDDQLVYLCGPCDKIKTAKDAGDRAKVKRLIARENGTRRPRKPIPSKGFDKTVKRAIPSRPFAKRGEVRS